jgi:hypothetical protein
VLLPRQRSKLATGAKDKEHAMSQILNAAIVVMGIDIGKNSLHVVGIDQRGSIVLRQKWSRGQVTARFANMPPCLIGMEACVGAHHLSRELKAWWHLHFAPSARPEQLRRSLTWDQGKEMNAHKRFTVATNVQVYFCDPRSPWQRGSNENTNGLLRQYFPRGTDFSRISQSYLNAIALRLNQRPRKTLGFETPADSLQAVLH